MLLKPLVQRLFKHAGIECNGKRPCDPQIHDDRFYRRILLNGSIGLGDSYMQGWWTCDRIDILIYRLLRSGITDLVPRFDDWWVKLFNRLIDRQDPVRALRVAEEHYNEDPEFFVDILGDTNSYTCARWQKGDSLDQAQIRKMDLLCRKAQLKPGQTVLDIGCGWGGFSAHAARRYGVKSIALSISEPQLQYARRQYGNLPIEFRNQDYRDFDGKADAAVSICMIEHVGPRHYREYFSRVRDALPQKGVFALQCITADTDYSMSDPWVDKQIFPGGNLVTMDRLHAAIKGLFHLWDEEFFGDDYVKTLVAWYRNLRFKRDRIVAIYGVEHFRKYEYYFLMCMGGFMSKRINVGQFVLSPSVSPHDYVAVR